MTSFRNLPETVTFTLALYLPSLHALASVDKKLRHVAGWATRDIIDDFLCSDFDVHCLRDFVGNEFVSKPTLDKICRRHLGEPSESIDHEVLFWVEAQLHLGLLCRRSRISLRHVLELCFMRSSFSKYSFKGLFPPWRLSHTCLAWRLSRARGAQWLETLRPVASAESQVIHLDIPGDVCAMEWSL